MQTLFLAWQDPERRRWYTVGRLDQRNGSYVFTYTKGAHEAKEAGFTPLVSFPDVGAKYESNDIFPLFANQVLPPNRPEYDDFIEWLSIPKDKADPVAILARTGERITETLEIFPQPQEADGSYSVHFFIRGLRHQSRCAIERAETLEEGEQLLLMSDLQNPYDEKAIVLRTAEQTHQDMHMLGYLPRYLADELYEAPRDKLRESRVEVVRVNHAPVPAQFRILCSLRLNWPDARKPFSSEAYQPINHN